MGKTLLPPRVSRRTIVVLVGALLCLAMFSGGVGFGYLLADHAPAQPEVEEGPCGWSTGMTVTEDLAAHGCMNDWKPFSPVVRECQDGRRLVQMGPLTGYVGEKFEESPQGENTLALRRWECITGI